MADPTRRGATIVGEALTFDDVLLLPGHSTVHPRDTDVRTRLTRSIELRSPSSRRPWTRSPSPGWPLRWPGGGLGIIHKNLSRSARPRKWTG
jgi:IMP dehydrogenase